ncbi:MAG TPA: hypothetical protein VMD74_05245 [Candidatus Methylomirabilis sp.]|nr:hypothetical protein [Candidatus Methylomirabilis sp.]
MKIRIKKIISVILGLLFLGFLAILPTLLIQSTVQGVRLAGKLKNLDNPKNKNQVQKPIASIEPIEKEEIFHFLPGSKVYALAAAEPMNQSTNDKNSNGERTPAAAIAEAMDAGAAVILTTCSGSGFSCDYSLSLAKLARENNLRLILVDDGYISHDRFADLLPYCAAVKIIFANDSSDFYRHAPDTFANYALDNISQARQSGKHLEIEWRLNPAVDSDNDINDLLMQLKNNFASDLILHFSAAENASSSTTILRQAVASAQQAGFKYVYADGPDFPNGENTFCPAAGNNSSGLFVAIKRQNDFLLQNNLTNGICPDGTAIPGIWK